MTVEAGAARMLVTAEELQANLANPSWRIVDCRFDLLRPEAGAAAYDAGHIPGARYAHLDRDLSAPVTASSGRHPLPEVPEFRRVLFRLGVGPATRVVAYDDAGGAVAARLWWLLRWLGHGAVSLLDGGLRAWCEAGYPLETGQAAPAQGPGVPARAGQMPVVDTAEVAAALAGDAAFVLIDVRTGERFRGESEPIDPVAGHVPGAVSLPLGRSLDARGCFQSPDVLRRNLLEAAGSLDGRRLVFMCGSGVTACHGIFAAELAGLQPAALYAGSWSEWIRDPERPVARG